MEALANEIHIERIASKRREEELNKINELTNTRVALFSLVSLVVCIVLAACQMLYLRSFFMRKKII